MSFEYKFLRKHGMHTIIVVTNLSIVKYLSSGSERIQICNFFSSVGDPDSQAPHVFGPPGSGSIRQRYRSGSFPFLVNVLGGLNNACK